MIIHVSDQEARRVRLDDGRVVILPPYGHGDAWTGGGTRSVDGTTRIRPVGRPS